ncbi:hypothetical protein STANM309S_04790 [Streptomyces tanashiensis]
MGKNNVYAGTGSYAVELLWVQPQGKKPMKAAGLGPRRPHRPGRATGRVTPLARTQALRPPTPDERAWAAPSPRAGNRPRGAVFPGGAGRT